MLPKSTTFPYTGEFKSQPIADNQEERNGRSSPPLPLCPFLLSFSPTLKKTQYVAFFKTQGTPRWQNIHDDSTLMLQVKSNPDRKAMGIQQKGSNLTDFKGNESPRNLWENDTKFRRDRVLLVTRKNPCILGEGSVTCPGSSVANERTP